jgi:hypothetical protein
MMNENSNPRAPTPEETIPAIRDNTSYDVKLYIGYDDNRKLKYPDYNKEASHILKWIAQYWQSSSEGQKTSCIYRIKNLPKKYRTGVWDLIVHNPTLAGDDLKEFSRLYRFSPVDRRE